MLIAFNSHSWANIPSTLSFSNSSFILHLPSLPERTDILISKRPSPKFLMGGQPSLSHKINKTFRYLRSCNPVELLQIKYTRKNLYNTNGIPPVS